MACSSYCAFEDTGEKYVGITDFYGYDSDKDKEYIPSDSEESVSDENSAVDNISVESQKASQTGLSKVLKRKTQRCSDTWKCNIRKKAHDAGKEYISVRKKFVPAKKIKTAKDCRNNCVYSCQNHISDDERKSVFERYYTLNEHGKRLSILSTAKKFLVERRRKDKADTNSRRKHTFKYCFDIGSR